MQELRQSTTITIQIGPFVDSVDGDTAETGLTITQSDVLLSKNGAAFAQKNDANAATHDTVGWYRVQINATDTGTLGRLLVQVRESGALVVWREFEVVTQDYWDMKYANGLSDISDDVLTRGMSNTENSADTTSLTALVLSALESSTSGATWTIRKTGGTTFVTKTLTLDASASQIIGVT
jgi:hypothetical protein